MNKLTKKQLLIGALILLFAINLAALGTIIYQNYRSNQSILTAPRFQPNNMPGPRGRGSMHQMEPGTNQGVGRRFDHIVRQRLELDEKQFGQYQELVEKTRRQQRQIAMKLEEKREQMMMELSKDEPDQRKLNKLANEIGDLHTQLKQHTIAHFKEFKAICRPEQRKALNQMMIEMSHHRPHQPGHNRPDNGRGRRRN